MCATSTNISIQIYTLLQKKTWKISIPGSSSAEFETWTHETPNSTESA